MCGILGIVSPGLNEGAAGNLELMAHRGPDDTGLYSDGKIVMGHKRLSIIELSYTGHQPMKSADGRYVIVFNGEIYNHRELRKKYLADIAFRGQADTETLLNGFIRYGAEFVTWMNGIFAFCIYDSKTGEVFIARDQFGVKPLYYYHEPDTLYFASELKAFQSLPFDKALDVEAISNYLYFLYSPGASTPFKKVKKLLAGHWLKFNVNRPSEFLIEKYYELPFTGTYFSDKLEEQLIAELEERLTQAVERQMLSDVPVGFFLSGGLDSSAIVAMARKLYPDKRLSCYTIDTGGNGEGFADDLGYAKKCARHLNVDLNIVKADIDIVQDFDKMIWHLDEPQADAAPLNVLNICKAARANQDIVLLGGTAGDDLFSGYRRHQALVAERYFSLLPAFMWKAASGILSRFSTSNPAIRRGQKLFRDAGEGKMKRMAGYYGWLPQTSVVGLFSQKAWQDIDPLHFSKIFLNSLSAIPEEKEALNQMLYWEMKYFLTDHNLNYSDKMSMAAGVEVRVPFLDKDLVEFSTKLPVKYKMKGRETKYILKKAMEKYLPHDVIYRPKTGFGAPVRDWITRDLNPMVQERLSKSNLDKWGIFDPNAVSQLIRDNQNGKIDASYSIWALLAIHSWLEQFVR